MNNFFGNFIYEGLFWVSFALAIAKASSFQRAFYKKAVKFSAYPTLLCAFIISNNVLLLCVSFGTASFF